MTGADPGYTHSGGGVMASAGVAPGSGRPVPSNRLIARTVMSWSHRIWHDSRTPVRPRSLRRSFSAAVIVEGSPSTNSTRHVVQRALPPQACMMSTPASCSTASTNRFCAGTSNVPYPSTVSWDMCIFYGTTPHRCQCRTPRPRGRETRSDLPGFPHEAWRRTQPTDTRRVPTLAEGLWCDGTVHGTGRTSVREYGNVRIVDRVVVIECTQHSDVGQMLSLACTVADALHRHIQLVQQRQIQIYQRSLVRVPDVAAPVEPACSPAGQEDRQVLDVMKVAVAMPLPYRIITWSRSEPSPSGVARSFWREYDNNPA